MEASVLLPRLPASNICVAGGKPSVSFLTPHSGAHLRWPLSLAAPLLLRSLSLFYALVVMWYHLFLLKKVHVMRSFPPKNLSCPSHVLLASEIRCEATTGTTSRGTSTAPELDWDNLGFGLVPTDYMYIMKCFKDGNFQKGELQKYGNIDLSPSSGVLNYGQGLFEGLKAYRTAEGKILLFRPEENALRMKMGAERMCMPYPSVQQFVDAVKQTVWANRHWVPPAGKGPLYIRPLLFGSGAILGLAPAPEHIFGVCFSCGELFQGRLSTNQLSCRESFSSCYSWWNWRYKDNRELRSSSEGTICSKV